MNRRGFLRALGGLVAAAAVVPSTLLQAVGEISAPAPMVWTSDAEVVKRWAQKLWLDLPHTVYFERFMRPGEGEAIVTVTKWRSLP